MIRVSNLQVPLSFEKDELIRAFARKVKIPPQAVREIRLVRKSVDARDRREICFVVAAEAEVDGNEQALVSRRRSHEITLAQPYRYQAVPCAGLAQRPVIAGFGPAGMFAALILAQAGQRPIVLERGESVSERQQSVRKFWQTGMLSAESNVQFGEGGAGTFSDGKLTTGTKDSRIQKVLEEFVKAGAPGEILYEAKPHLGTDQLPGIVRAIRMEILRLGGEVRFGSKLTELHFSGGALNAVSVRTGGMEEKIPCSSLVLAVGHSARDTFTMLYEKKLAMQAKPFSVGARIEHPAALIDSAQYGDFAGSPFLGAADYKLSRRLANGRGVYSFCMCPGGTVVAAASEEKMVATNGMSEFARDGKNSNAALLVGVTPEDFGTQPLDGVAFQRRIERAAFVLGGSDYRAPAQRVGDFLRGVPSERLGDSFISASYEPGVRPADIAGCLPDFVADGMREGIRAFGRTLKGFDCGDALLTAPETRSSSPVRILRDESGQSLSVRGVYPCGEGAGYAGGITSAAVDGIRCAEKILEKG